MMILSGRVHVRVRAASRIAKHRLEKVAETAVRAAAPNGSTELKALIPVRGV
jgi:hypothetical protein